MTETRHVAAWMSGLLCGLATAILFLPLSLELRVATGALCGLGIAAATLQALGGEPRGERFPLLEGIIERYDAPSLLTNREGRIVAANAALLERWHMELDDCRGCNLEDIIFNPPELSRDYFQSWTVELYVPAERTAGVSMTTEITPLRDCSGDAVGFLFAALSDALRSSPSSQSYGLSPRETEVAECLAGGLTGKQVGRRLGITERTVKAHITNIYRKLGISGRRELLSRLRPK